MIDGWWSIGVSFAAGIKFKAMNDIAKAGSRTPSKMELSAYKILKLTGQQ
jgi:hypothetical protein